MALNRSDLQLLKYIQEKNQVSLPKLTEHFHKNGSTIRREIDGLNHYLPIGKGLLVKNGLVYNRLSYIEYTDFILSLTINDYDTAFDERLLVILVKNLLSGYVNLSRLYEGWGLSLTTKKNDSRKLRDYLKARGLKLKILVKKGVEICGDELYLRIHILQILLPLIELKDHYGLERRKANTPLEKEIADAFFQTFPTVESECLELVTAFMESERRTLSYSSKKFLILYTAISLLRKSAPKIIQKETVPVEPFALYLFPDPYENQSFNQILAMLDFDPTLDFQVNETLLELTRRFLDHIQQRIITKLHTYEEIIQELYDYILKQLVCIYYDFTFRDKMVRNTDQHIPKLYQDVTYCIRELEEFYKITFKEEQITTITLLLRKWINKNKLYGRNVKRIIIVTNTTFERVRFFTDMLADQVEFQLSAVLDLHEVYRIDAFTYDFIITFSDRIRLIMNKIGHSVIKLNFFLEQEDIEYLLQSGFSASKRHFLAAKAAKELCNKEEKQLEELLKSNYNGLFI